MFKVLLSLLLSIFVSGLALAFDLDSYKSRVEIAKAKHYERIELKVTGTAHNQAPFLAVINDLRAAVEDLNKQLAGDSSNQELADVLIEAANFYCRMVNWEVAEFKKFPQFLEESKAYAIKGKEVAKILKEVDFGSPSGSYWYAVMLGRWGQANGIGNSLFIRPELESNMSEVIEFGEYTDEFGTGADKASDQYDRGGVYRTWGTLYQLVDLNYDKAIMTFKKAVAIDPTYSANLAFLAEVYIAKGDKENAKKTLTAVIALDKEIQIDTIADLDKKESYKQLKLDVRKAKELLIDLK